MQFTVNRVLEKNYRLFDDMIYWRMNGIERSDKKVDEVIVPLALKNHHLKVFAIETQGKFVGWISLIYLPKVGRKNNNGYIYVDELWVQESFRRLGFARALLKKADDYCLEVQCVGVRLNVNTLNPTALKLYETSGYESTGQAYTMEKLIDKLD